MLSRMKYIDRWGLMRCTRKETLSEHTLETAMLAHALVEIGNNRFGRNLDSGKAALMAMYHDCAEIITGDLPTPVKYHDPAIKSAYDRIEASALERLLLMLPEDMRSSFEEYISPDEQQSAVYEPFVKAADKLSALIKCIEEQKAGNGEFKKAYETTLAHPALELPEAKEFIRDFLPAYELTLDEIEKFGE